MQFQGKLRFDLCFPLVEFVQWNVGAWVVMLLRVRVWQDDFPGFGGDDYSVGWFRVVCARGDVVFVHLWLSFG